MQTQVVYINMQFSPIKNILSASAKVLHGDYDIYIHCNILIIRHIFPHSVDSGVEMNYWLALLIGHQTGMCLSILCVIA